MKQLFTTLSDHLKNNVSELKWIDADYGQTDHYELRTTLAFPALLIRISIRPEELGQGNQLYQAQVELRVVFNPTTRRTNAHTAPQTREQALEHYNIADKIYTALQGFKNNQYTPFECTHKTQENRNDGLLIIRFSFNTSFWDFRKTP